MACKRGNSIPNRARSLGLALLFAASLGSISIVPAMAQDNSPDPGVRCAAKVGPGNKSGQEAFNPLKGSIPARTDVNRSKFGVYHNWSMDSFGSGVLLPSLEHGEAAPAAFQQSFNDAVTSFGVGHNVDAFAQALVNAMQASGQ